MPSCPPRPPRMPLIPAHRLPTSERLLRLQARQVRQCGAGVRLAGAVAGRARPPVLRLPVLRQSLRRDRSKTRARPPPCGPTSAPPRARRRRSPTSVPRRRGTRRAGAEPGRRRRRGQDGGASAGGRKPAAGDRAAAPARASSSIDNWPSPDNGPGPPTNDETRHLKDGTRDGQLVVVSRDLRTPTMRSAIATRCSAARRLDLLLAATARTCRRR